MKEVPFTQITVKWIHLNDQENTGVKSRIQKDRGADVITPELPADLADDPEYLFLVEEFIGRLPQTINDVNQLLAGENWDVLAQAMHNLKGSAGGFGFQRLTDQASNIYALVHENVTGDVQGLVEQLMADCQGIKISA